MKNRLTIEAEEYMPSWWINFLKTIPDFNDISWYRIVRDPALKKFNARLLNDGHLIHLDFEESEDMTAFLLIMK